MGDPKPETVEACREFLVAEDLISEPFDRGERELVDALALFVEEREAALRKQALDAHRAGFKEGIERQMERERDLDRPEYRGAAMQAIRVTEAKLSAALGTEIAKADDEERQRGEAEQREAQLRADIDVWIKTADRHLTRTQAVESALASAREEIAILLMPGDTLRDALASEKKAREEAEAKLRDADKEIEVQRNLMARSMPSVFVDEIKKREETITALRSEVERLRGVREMRTFVDPYKGAQELEDQLEQVLTFLRKAAYIHLEIVSTSKLSALNIENYRKAGLMYVEPGGGCGWVVRKSAPPWAQADQDREIAEITKRAEQAEARLARVEKALRLMYDEWISQTRDKGEQTDILCCHSAMAEEAARAALEPQP
jgi:hypothetical protein